MEKTGFIKRLKAYLACHNGATAIEYALIAAGIGIVIVTMVYLAGDQVNGLFTLVRTAVADAATRG